jgi:hypothetical protein
MNKVAKKEAQHRLVLIPMNKVAKREVQHRLVLIPMNKVAKRGKQHQRLAPLPVAKNAGDCRRRNQTE